MDLFKKLGDIMNSEIQERERLVADETRITNQSGRFLFSVPLTERQIEILDNQDRKEDEPWISCRERTKAERELEKLKQFQFAREIAEAYNEKYNL